MSKQQQREDIVNLTFQVGRLLRRHKSRSDESNKLHEPLNPYHLYALSTLLEDDATTMGELAHEMNISFSSATALVDRLVKSGWVERGLDPDDRRIIRLSVTLKARQMLKKRKDEHYKAFDFILDLLPPQDVAAMQRILTNLKAGLERHNTDINT